MSVVCWISILALRIGRSRSPLRLIGRIYMDVVDISTCGLLALAETFDESCS